MKFVCSKGLSATAYVIGVRVTKCTHSWVVGLRLVGHLGSLILSKLLVNVNRTPIFMPPRGARGILFVAALRACATMY